MHLVVVHESLCDDGIAYVDVKDFAAFLTFKMGVGNDIGLVANLALIDGETQYEASFLKEIEGVVYRCLRKGWNFPDQFAIDHLNGWMTEVVQEILQYPQPLVGWIYSDLRQKSFGILDSYHIFLHALSSPDGQALYVRHLTYFYILYTPPTRGWCVLVQLSVGSHAVINQWSGFPDEH